MNRDQEIIAASRLVRDTLWTRQTYFKRKQANPDVEIVMPSKRHEMHDMRVLAANLTPEEWAMLCYIDHLWDRLRFDDDQDDYAPVNLAKLDAICDEAREMLTQQADLAWEYKPHALHKPDESA